jgi:hypothetical protein
MESKNIYKMLFIFYFFNMLKGETDLGIYLISHDNLVILIILI